MKSEIQNERKKKNKMNKEVKQGAPPPPATDEPATDEPATPEPEACFGYYIAPPGVKHGHYTVFK